MGFAVFIAILLIGLYLNLYGLPGTVLIFLDVTVFALATGFEHVGWKVLLALLLVALVAETIDFLLGLTSVHHPPVTKKSLAGALFGGFLFMALLTPFLMGLGIWGGFFLGALTGMVVMELSRQSRLKAPHQASWQKMLGMIGQKALKGLWSLAMIFIALTHIYN